MSLVDSEHAAPGRHPYLDRGCAFGQWVKSLTAPERTAIEGWLDMDSGWPHTRISERIKADEDYPGIEFPADAISRHRRRECRCAR